MDGNGLKWMEMAKKCHNSRNGQKWLKTAKNGKKKTQILTTLKLDDPESR